MKKRSRVEEGWLAGIPALKMSPKLNCVTAAKRDACNSQPRPTLIAQRPVGSLSNTRFGGGPGRARVKGAEGTSKRRAVFLLSWAGATTDCMCYRCGVPWAHARLQPVSPVPSPPPTWSSWRRRRTKSVPGPHGQLDPPTAGLLLAGEALPCHSFFHFPSCSSPCATAVPSPTPQGHNLQ